nr:pyruvate, phosphate dikinase [Tanacetum cinerariifolium]
MDDISKTAFLPLSRLLAVTCEPSIATKFLSFDERLKAVRKMIMSVTIEQIKAALSLLLLYQRPEFEGIFRPMDGFQMMIHLLDPPLHEFPLDSDLKQIIGELTTDTSMTKDEIYSRIEKLLEVNPKLGFRGYSCSSHANIKCADILSTVVFDILAIESIIDLRAMILDIWLMIHMTPLCLNGSTRIINPQETQQVIAHDEKRVPYTERVKISPTNAFTISAEVPKFFMQQFWYTIKKIQGTDSYKFVLANKWCVVDAEVFRKILDICSRVKGEEFTKVHDNDATLTFLIGLGSKGLLHKLTNMENIDYPELIWEDFIFQINHMMEKKSRRENMPFPRFTKVIINHFLSQHKSLSKVKFQHYHTIRDDGIVNRLKFVRTREDYQEYGLPILDMMLNDKIKQSECYQMFLKYSTGLIPHKKSRGKWSQGKKTADVSQELVDVSDEFEPEPTKKKTCNRSTRGVVIQDTSSAPKPKPAASKLKQKGIRILTLVEQEAADTMQALKESKKTSRRQLGTRGSSEGTSKISRVLDESTVVSATSSERTGTKPGVPDKEKVTVTPPNWVAAEYQVRGVLHHGSITQDIY